MNRCPNEGCRKELPKAELQPHLERCAHRTAPCNLCNADIVLSNFIEHCTTACPKRSVICKICTAAIFAEETKEHSRTCHVTGDGDKEKSAVPKGKGGPKKKAKSGGTNTEAEVKELRKLLNSAMKEIADLKLSQSIQERKTAALLRRAGPSFVWCLESYRRLRRNAISRRDDCLSEPFFFGLAGCKFRLQANLYGVGGGAGTHMAFFVQFKVVDLARMDSCCVKKTRGIATSVKEPHGHVQCLIRVASQREGVEHVDHTFDFSASGQDRRRSTSRPLHMWNTLFGREKFILFQELEDQRVGYVVDDMLILEFHVID